MEHAGLRVRPAESEYYCPALNIPSIHRRLTAIGLLAKVHDLRAPSVFATPFNSMTTSPKPDKLSLRSTGRNDLAQRTHTHVGQHAAPIQWILDFAYACLLPKSKPQNNRNINHGGCGKCATSIELHVGAQHFTNGGALE